MLSKITFDEVWEMSVVSEAFQNFNALSLRSLEFTQELMLRLANQEGDLSSDDMRHVVGDVYEKVLKNYHCWVVRSAFYVSNL